MPISTNRSAQYSVLSVNVQIHGCNHEAQKSACESPFSCFWEDCVHHMSKTDGRSQVRLTDKVTH